MANVQSKLENNTLFLLLDGRVDSQNSADVETAVTEALATTEHQAVVVDAENLEYISSAGLRVLLRLRKKEPSLKIINASSEVYEIFDMTGFVEMMPIEKALRRINIDGCEVIGEGASGKVLRIDPDTIVKYYFRDSALEDIQRERELARKAFIMGIPTAIPYDVVKVNDGYGSVFELLNADSFQKLILREPEKIDDYIALSVLVMRKIHATEVGKDELPNRNEIGVSWVKGIYDLLPSETAEKLLAMFKAVPDSCHMMHGDYHIKNIMMQNLEVILIDMDTLCRGNAVYELAGIFNAYVAYSDLDHGNTMEFFGIEYDTAQHLWNKTAELYIGGTADEIELAKKKAALVGYTQMFYLFSQDAPDSEKTAHYKAKVIELTNTLDSVAF